MPGEIVVGEPDGPAIFHHVGNDEDFGMFRQAELVARRRLELAEIAADGDQFGRGQLLVAQDQETMFGQRRHHGLGPFGSEPARVEVEDLGARRAGQGFEA